MADGKTKGKGKTESGMVGAVEQQGIGLGQLLGLLRVHGVESFSDGKLSVTFNKDRAYFQKPIIEQEFDAEEIEKVEQLKKMDEEEMLYYSAKGNK